MKSERLGTLLIDKYQIDSELIERALEAAKGSGVRLGEWLITEFGVSDETVYKALAELFNIPFSQYMRFPRIM